MTENTIITDSLVLKLVDNATVFFLYTDINQKIVFCNKKVTDFIGCKKEELIGAQWSEYLYRDTSSKGQLQMVKALIEDSVTYCRANHFESFLSDVNKLQRIIAWDIVPFFDQARVPEGLLFVGNDLSELASHDSSLTKIDETLKNILSNIKEYALYVTNLDGNITYYAMGSELMFGWPKAEIIFKHVRALHAPEQSNTDLPFMLSEVAGKGKYDAEISMLRKSGETFPVNLTIVKFFDTEGKHSGYIFIAKDITEKKKLEYQVFQAEKMSAIGQLAAGMAHDINNPLFVIAGKTEMLLEEEHLSDDIKKDLTIIHAQADRIRKLVERLLKFARKTAPHSEIININDTLEGVLPLVSYHKLPNSTVAIEKRFTDNISPIKGDLNQLQEVFINLIINAHQAMPSGGTLTIETGSYLDQYAQIKIADTGHGISSENLKNIFVPFFSTKKEGTGLGLSICYNIIKNHGGTIGVDSIPHKGTTFIIRLPFV